MVRGSARSTRWMGGLCGLGVVVFLMHDGGYVGADRILGTLGHHHVWAQQKSTTGSVTRLKVEPLYRAVKMSWTAAIEGSGPVVFEIHRSQAKPDGPYTPVASVEWKTGVSKYEYVDKNLPVEENYFYKIEIPATQETFGPLQVRPPFSLPTT